MAEYKVPYEFVAGTRAKASQVNENFKVLVQDVTNLDENKADVAGSSKNNFYVKEPIEDSHAATKKYVDNLVAEKLGAKGSGTGKALFEIFHTLSLDTPPGAFSLREGLLVPKAYEDYPDFVNSLQDKGSGAIKDLTQGIPDLEDSSTSQANYRIVEDPNHPLGTIYGTDIPTSRIFSPYSWVTTSFTKGEQVVLYMIIPEPIHCDAFKINSHVNDTYNSAETGLGADPSRAISSFSVHVAHMSPGFPEGATDDEKQALMTEYLNNLDPLTIPNNAWQQAVSVIEKNQPEENYRFYNVSDTVKDPEYTFNVIRFSASGNFGSDKIDLSLYPFSKEHNSIRLVPKAQWDYEIEHYKQTGSFVYNEKTDSVHLPKITGILSGLEELYDIGQSTNISFSGSAVRWQDDSGEESEVETKTLDVFKTGLWIQAYNAIAEEAIANMRYVTNATLFEERMFSYIPDKSTGWFVADPTVWRDADEFLTAWSVLSNNYANAMSINKTIEYYTNVPAKDNTTQVIISKDTSKIYHNIEHVKDSLSFTLHLDLESRMGFVDSDTYDNFIQIFGSCPYFSVKTETDEIGDNHYFFKTPISSSYYRPTWKLDEMNKQFLSSLPELHGEVPGTEGARRYKDTATNKNPEIQQAMRDSSTITGTFVTESGNTTNGSSANDTYDNNVFGFYASLGNSVYGRSDDQGMKYQVLPDTSMRIVCVFLGNQIPEDHYVSVFKQLEETQEVLDALSSGTADKVNALSTRITSLETSDSSQNQRISIIESDLDPDVEDSLANKVSELENTINGENNPDSIVSQVDAAKATAQSASLQSVQAQTESSATKNSLIELKAGSTSTLKTIDESISAINSTVSSLSSSLNDKASLSSVNELKGNLGATNQRVTSLETSKADASSLNAIIDGSTSTLKTIDESISAINTSLDAKAADSVVQSLLIRVAALEEKLNNMSQTE